MMKKIEIKQEYNMKIYVSGLCEISHNQDKSNNDEKYIPQIKLINPELSVNLKTIEKNPKTIAFGHFRIDEIFKEMTTDYIKDNASFDIERAITALLIYQKMEESIQKEIKFIEQKIENYKSS